MMVPRTAGWPDWLRLQNRALLGGCHGSCSVALGQLRDPLASGSAHRVTRTKDHTTTWSCENKILKSGIIVTIGCGQYLTPIPVFINIETTAQTLPCWCCCCRGGGDSDAASRSWPAQRLKRCWAGIACRSSCLLAPPHSLRTGTGDGGRPGPGRCDAAPGPSMCVAISLSAFTPFIWYHILTYRTTSFIGIWSLLHISLFHYELDIYIYMNYIM